MHCEVIGRVKVEHWVYFLVFIQDRRTSKFEQVK